MSKCRRYEKSKIINIILQNHFEKFKEEKLPKIKSKFCTKCGRMYSIKWSEKQADNMLNVKHRHAVFTIPAIAEYRISEYDGKNVTFWYENKNPKEKITVKMDSLDFIVKLVNHIHLKGFRVVRRYGLYSRMKNKLSIEIVKLYNFIKQRNIFELI